MSGVSVDRLRAEPARRADHHPKTASGFLRTLSGRDVGPTATSSGRCLKENGAPGTIRTSDPQIRSLMLYPAELRARLAANGEGGYLAEAGAGGKGCPAGFR